jgi:hypothetical protein
MSPSPNRSGENNDSGFTNEYLTVAEARECGFVPYEAYGMYYKAVGNRIFFNPMMGDGTMEVTLIDGVVEENEADHFQDGSPTKEELLHLLSEDAGSKSVTH